MPRRWDDGVPVTTKNPYFCRQIRQRVIAKRKRYKALVLMGWRRPIRESRK